MLQNPNIAPNTCCTLRELLTEKATQELRFNDQLDFFARLLTLSLLLSKLVRGEVEEFAAQSRAPNFKRRNFKFQIEISLISNYERLELSHI